LSESSGSPYFSALQEALMGTMRPSVGRHFDYFFGRINPAPTFRSVASREYAVVKSLLEDPNGPAAILSPKCYLQGSYGQETAIHSINDVDVVVLTNLEYPGQPGSGVRTWSRHEIFDTLAMALAVHGPYRGKIAYNQGSTCIKIKLGIKLELLPVVKSAQGGPAPEFFLWRPERQQWEAGYGQRHREWLSAKNTTIITQGNYIPMVKVLKHLRTVHGIDAVSFHIESLLHSFPNAVFLGGPAEYIPRVLAHFAQYTADQWYAAGIRTPCQERLIHHETEWDYARWQKFHMEAVKWAGYAARAQGATTQIEAIQWWQALLGNQYFPATVSL